MKFEKDTVYTIKLNSGEELVAKVISSEFGSVTVSKPVSMAPGPQGLQLVPSLFSSHPDKNVDINIASIAMATLTRDDVETAYVEATTDIAVGSKQILAG